MATVELAASRLPSMSVGGVQVYGLSDGTLPTGLDKVVDMDRAQALALVGETDANGAATR
jgi:hypothetical protein